MSDDERPSKRSKRAEAESDDEDDDSGDEEIIDAKTGKKTSKGGSSCHQVSGAAAASGDAGKEELGLQSLRSACIMHTLELPVCTTIEVESAADSFV